MSYTDLCSLFRTEKMIRRTENLKIFRSNIVSKLTLNSNSTRDMLISKYIVQTCIEKNTDPEIPQNNKTQS